MKLLITGGTTLASKFAAEYFVNKGCEVYCINRNSRKQISGIILINRNSIYNRKPYIEFIDKNLQSI